MNTLQPLPPGAKSAPSVPTTGKPPFGEATPFAKKIPVDQSLAGPAVPLNTPAVALNTSAGTNGVTGGAKPLVPPAAEQLADAREATSEAVAQRKEQAEKAAQAAKEAAEAKKKAAALEGGTLERKVGLVEGTTEVFVDLVDPVRERSVFRVFGPQDEAQHKEQAHTAAQPQNTGATTAYGRTGAPSVLKDVGVA